jgi:predicted  nucleic acid-binding Zn-ribbon protein
MKTIKEQLLLLVDLQNIDIKISKIETENNNLLKKLQDLENEIKPQIEEFENKKKTLKEKEVEQMNLQVDLKEKENQLKDLQEKFYKVRNPKQLNAIDIEITNTKKIISELEEKGVKLLEEIDGLKKNLNDIEQIINEQNKIISETKNEIEESKKKNSEILEQLKSERSKITQQIEPEILKDYEYIASRKNGIGVVAVKDGICTGCYMSIPPQTIHNIKKYLNIYHCQNCSRILYVPDW